MDADICASVQRICPAAVSEVIRVIINDGKHTHARSGRMCVCWLITGVFDGVHLPPGVSTGASRGSFSTVTTALFNSLLSLVCSARLMILFIYL